MVDLTTGGYFSLFFGVVTILNRIEIVAVTSIDIIIKLKLSANTREAWAKTFSIIVLIVSDEINKTTDNINNILRYAPWFSACQLVLSWHYKIMEKSSSRRQGSGNFVAGRVEKNFAALTSFSEDMRARGRVPVHTCTHKQAHVQKLRRRARARAPPPHRAVSSLAR